MANLPCLATWPRVHLCFLGLYETQQRPLLAILQNQVKSFVFFIVKRFVEFDNVGVVQCAHNVDLHLQHLLQLVLPQKHLLF